MVGAIIDGLPVDLLTLGLVTVAVLLLALGIGAVIAFLDYRNRRFRLTDELFELRSGVIGKNHRQVRLDRLQSVNLKRPFVARLFGMTKLETSGAGKDSDIELSYLLAADAEGLRAEVLRMASGARKRKQGQGDPSAPNPSPITPDHDTPSSEGAHPDRRTLGDYLDAAVADFTSAELPEGEFPEQAVLRVPPTRIFMATFLRALFGSVAVLLVTVVVAVVLVPIIIVNLDGTAPGLIAAAVALSVLGLGVLMVVLSVVGAAASLLDLANYTIAGTPDGIRIGKGLLSQTSDTVPPGRIHCVQVHQSLFWRALGWYQVKVDRADLQHDPTADSNKRAAMQQRQVVLPVGTWDDVQRTLALVLPMHMSPNTAELITTGMQPGSQPGYVSSPERAKWLHLLSWRRLGYAIDSGLIYLRRGFFTRRVSLIPAERIQSVTLHDGPLRRAFGVVSLWINTVGNAVRTKLPNVDEAASVPLFDHLAELAVAQAVLDTSHRWNEAQARTVVATARIAVDEAQRRGEQPPAEARRVLGAEAAWRNDNDDGAAG